MENADLVIIGAGVSLPPTCLQVPIFLDAPPVLMKDRIADDLSMRSQQDGMDWLPQRPTSR